MSGLITPILGPGSQLHVLRRQAQEVGLEHPQVARVYASQLNVVHGPKEGIGEVRFCNFNMTVEEVWGTGDKKPFPRTAGAVIVGTPFEAYGYQEALLMIASNGVIHITVLEAIPHQKIFVGVDVPQVRPIRQNLAEIPPSADSMPLSSLGGSRRTGVGLEIQQTLPVGVSLPV